MSTLFQPPSTLLPDEPEIRANLNLKTPDAIHLASAILAGATALLTGDRNLARCPEVRVEIL